MPGRPDYSQILKAMKDWDGYLMQESGLPGPRGNLELVQAAADLASKDQIAHWLSFGVDQAPVNTPGEFLPVVGAVGLGRYIAEGELGLLKDLRPYATDPRWRIREGVAMALQRLGKVDMARLLDEMEIWSQGNWLEKRAAAAALAEPVLLKDPAQISRVLNLFDRVTAAMASATDRKDESYRVLRKGMAYCWSVGVAALPLAGKPLMERWFATADPDIAWIMRENLKKDRLKRMDAAWVAHWSERLARTD